MTPPDPEARADALAEFTNLTGAPDIERITQRGRDHETARFTIHLTNGREVRLRNIQDFWSQAKLSQAIVVASGRVLKRVKPSDWTDAMAVLFNDCVDVEETPGESFEDTVREWLTGYLAATSSLDTDTNNAAAQGQAFRDQDGLHISAGQLAKYIRREFSEQVKLPELRTALTDLAFTRKTVMYTKGGKRSSASYYVLTDTTTLLPEQEPESVT